MMRYYQLMKPGIVFGNLITVAAGFLLASTEGIHVGLLIATLLGLALIMSSGCVFNNYIDRELDRKMERTQKRVLVQGLVTHREAILLGLTLGALGNGILFFYTNFITLLIADFGFFVYVILYSLWKSRTVYGTAIGSVAGAVPPVVGYCAVSNALDLAAIIFFAMMVFWQMPHFFSIAIYRMQDYAAASIPVLPIKKGMLRTKIHMTIYIAGFIAAAALLTFFHFTGTFYLIFSSALGCLWLALCLKGFTSPDETQWARYMFRLSLIVITALCIVIPFDIAK